MKEDIQLTAIFEEEEDGHGYTVTSPSVPGCVSFGKTVEEAKKNFQKAVRLHLSCLKAHSKSKKLTPARSVFTAVLHLTAA